MSESKGKINDVKSNFILKLIFSPLTEYIKLDLINYNKAIQKRLNISIENYKNRCKIKIIGKRNGKGKEYDLNTDKLVFEGEYLNGRRNGKGIEYNIVREIKFEGEFLNGKKIEGKGYNKNNKIVFTLERNGKGEEYYHNGNLLFKGEYIHGKRWNGTGYDSFGYEEFEINKGKGWGKQYYGNGHLQYEGEYLNGKIKEGKEFNKKGILVYEGEYLNEEKNGKGKEFYIDGNIRAEGIYLNGKIIKGKEYNCNGMLIFEGEYLNGKRNGKGKEYSNINTDNNKLITVDPFLDEDKLYETELSNYIFYLKFEGEYLDGKMKKGKEYDSNGVLIFEGEYLDGKKWKGKEYNSEGELQFEGEKKMEWKRKRNYNKKL